jgi:alpha/beta superfamily hydrolase
LQGDHDSVVPVEAVQKLVTKLSHQRDIKIDFRKVPGADHLFADRVDALVGHVDGYIGDHAGATSKARVSSHGRGTR